MLQQCLITKAYWKTPEQHCYTSLPSPGSFVVRLRGGEMNA